MAPPSGSLRAAQRFVAGLLLAVLTAAPACGEEPTVVLVDGLAAPVGMSASPSPSGGVLIVQQNGPAVVYWAAGYEQTVGLIEAPPAGLESPAAKATAVAFLSPQNFVVAWQDPAGAAAISLHTFDPQGSGLGSPAQTLTTKSVRRLDGEELDAEGATITWLARGEKFLYACGGSPSRLLRARHNAGLLSKFRLVAQLDRDASACCETPEGYALATVGGSLTFFNPAEPQTPALVSYDSQLDRLTGVAYGGVERPYSRLLYVLATGRNSASKAGRRPAGLYRIDAGLDANDRPTCSASLLLAEDGLRAMAFAADGSLLLLQAESADAGRLLRVDAEL